MYQMDMIRVQSTIRIGWWLKVSSKRMKNELDLYTLRTTKKKKKKSIARATNMCFTQRAMNDKNNIVKRLTSHPKIPMWMWNHVNQRINTLYVSKKKKENILSDSLCFDIWRELNTSYVLITNKRNTQMTIKSFFFFLKLTHKISTPAINMMQSMYLYEFLFWTKQQHFIFNVFWHLLIVNVEGSIQ